MIRLPPRSTLSSSSAASDVYKRQVYKVGEFSIYGGNAHHITSGIGHQTVIYGVYSSKMVQRSSFSDMHRVGHVTQILSCSSHAFDIELSILLVNLSLKRGKYDSTISYDISICLLYTSPSPRD